MSESVTLSTKKISFVKKGTSPQIIVLIHGWGGSSKSLEKLQDLLSATFTTYALDLPGFGDSDLPNTDWGIPEYSKVILDFLSSQNIKQCIYFGHSFGGALGIYIAAKFPQNVQSLILCAPSFKREPNDGTRAQLLSQFYKKLHLPELWIVKKAYYKILSPNSDLYKFSNLESNFKKIITQDLTPLISSVNQNTLIIWGDKDTYVPVIDGRLLHKGINSSTFIEHKGKRHGLPLHDPYVIYKDIMDFLHL